MCLHVLVMFLSCFSVILKKYIQSLSNCWSISGIKHSFADEMKCAGQCLSLTGLHNVVQTASLHFYLNSKLLNKPVAKQLHAVDV